MSDRSWRDFFESRSFYEYQIFSQKLPLRYAARRAHTFQASPFVPNRDFEEIRWRRRRRRRCAGFYWCCCCKIIALLVITLALLSTIGGLSYYFSKKESSQRGNHLSTTTHPNWTYPATSWNPYTNGSTIFGTTTRTPIDGTLTTEGHFKMSSNSDPVETTATTSETKRSMALSTTTTMTTANYTLNTLIGKVSDSTTTSGNVFSPQTTTSSDVSTPSTVNSVEASSKGVDTNPTTQTPIATETPTVQETGTTMRTVIQQTSPSQTRTNSTDSLTSTMKPINVTSGGGRTTLSNTGASEGQDERTTSLFSGHTTDFYDTADQKSTSSGYSTGLSTPAEDKDRSTLLAEGTTLEEIGKESTITPLPWMNISSTMLTGDFTEDEEMTTPESWFNVSSSTLSDGLTETGSGMSEDD